MNKRNISKDSREKWLQRQSRERIKAEKKRLEDAKAAWKSLGAEKNGKIKQMCILSELVETRGKELRQAYESVVGVAYGYRTKKGRLKQVPSITFTVSEKYPDDSKKLTEKNRIPDFLFTYCTVRNEHTLCAIPTDVEDMSVYKDVTPQSGSGYIIVKPSNSKPSNSDKAAQGTLTCAIRIINPKEDNDDDDNDDGKLYVMSCLHVLGMAQEFYPNFASNVKVFLGNEEQLIGRFSKHCGYIEDEFSYSFDAALAEVDNKSALKHAIPGPKPSDIIYEEYLIPDHYYIWTSHGKIFADKHMTWYGREKLIPYADSSGLASLKIYHDILIESVANTKPGDSGSPVVTTDGKNLVGMHIAGGSGRAFMIPAFKLFEAWRYSGLSINNEFRIVNNY